MSDYRAVFLAESADFLQSITDGLLALESEPNDMAPVEVIFRGAHSLKGMASAMGYERTADLTHKMEGLMDRVRKGDLAASEALITLMLGAVDLTRDLIDDESNGRNNVDPGEMLSALEAVAARAVHPDVVLPDAVVDAPAALPEDGSAPTWHLQVRLEPTCVLKAVRAYMVLKRLNHAGRVVSTVPTARQIEDEEFDYEFEVTLQSNSSASSLESAVMQISEVASVSVVQVAGVVNAPAPAAAPGAPAAERRKQSVPKLSDTQTVRVSISHLDTLVDLVGELVILRSRLDGIAERREDTELSETLDDLLRISLDLQYEVMQTRMVPVGNIFNRFPRMVRDLAMDLGKKIDFEMQGMDIELDRTVLDEIGDPLVHLLRNSIDHGIEKPDDRLKKGKPASGSITLSANRERDHIAIEVRDDGKGISADGVWEKAVEKGFVQADARHEYDAREILLLTCLPGFSTTESANKVSGRGVGMDAVKGKIEHLGGTIEIHSTPDEGTSFVMRLPLTVAIVSALVVRCEGSDFALPLSAVEEVFAIEDVRVETVDGGPVMVMRGGSVVPIRRLSSILFDVTPQDKHEFAPRSSIVLLRAGEDTKALHVDAFGGRTEIVVKPLSRLLRDNKGFSGATILGDGRVMLIIDPRTVFSAREVHK
jgi:two-component system chemotaxis sensor kinase CheA